ncbi:MAG: chorismate mutase [Pseudomonadota bacterium]
MRTVCLLGQDIRHSLSPLLHNGAFRALGLDWTYVLAPVAADLAAAVRGLQALGFAGANVTMPYKQAVLGYLDDVDDLARLVGAVNTIVVQPDGRLLGRNSDVGGFSTTLAAHGIDASARPARVVGAGGAARAVVFALAAAGCPAITVVNRTQARALRLVEEARAVWPGTRWQVLRWPEQIAADLPPDALIVNCTCVGAAGSPVAGRMPWPQDAAFGPGHAVLDLVYAPRQPPLLAKARRDGAALVLDGTEPLARQAAISSGWWTGRPPPVEHMLAALAEHPAEPEEVIERLRGRIDGVDVALLDVIARRMALVDELGRHKAELGSSVASAEREAEVHHRWRAVADELGLPRGLARTILDALLEESRRRQRAARGEG